MQVIFFTPFSHLKCIFYPYDFFKKKIEIKNMSGELFNECIQNQ